MPTNKPKSLRMRVVSGGPFQRPAEPYEPCFRPPDASRAVQLRACFPIAEAAGPGTDFTRMRRLMNWVRSRWNHGFSTDVGGADAHILLEAAAQGASFCCGHYAHTLVQCAVSLGIPARVVNLSRKTADFPYGCKGNFGHVAAEAYCREAGKWVLFDADLNCHFARGGEPLHALDLHRAWHGGQVDGIEQVLDEPFFVQPQPCQGYTAADVRGFWRDFTRHRSIDFYHHIQTSLAQGFTEQETPGMPDRVLWFSGEAHPLMAINFSGDLDLDAHVLTAREEQFNWPIQRTYILAHMLGETPSRRVEVRLQHTMPFFSYFELAVNNGPFRRMPGNYHVLNLPDGRTKVRARCVDVLGLPGHEAHLVIEVKALERKPQRPKNRG